MKEVQNKLVVVQEVVRLRQKDSGAKLQSWIKLLHEANTILEAAIVTYEMTHMSVKMHYSIYLNLIEAKIENLGSAGADGSLPPNPYVEIWVDSSRRARSRALWVENCPVWNQTFDVMVPQDAEEVTFKLFSESKDGLSDPTFLGKSDLALSSFKDRPGVSTEWLPMYSRGIGAVTEASSLHAIVKYKPGVVPNQGSLTVIVVEAKKLVEDGADLPSAYCRMSVIDQGSEKASPSASASSVSPSSPPTDHRSPSPSSQSREAREGTSPSAPISYDDCNVSLDALTPLSPSKKERKEKDKSSLKAEKVQKSNIVKKNDNPYWEEGFIFKFRWDHIRGTKLLIEVHDDRQSKQSFMGFAVIPLSAVAPDPSKPSELDRWFKLKRRAGKNDSDVSSSANSLPQIGQIKFDIQYREERLLPDSFYDPLFDLFQDEHRFLINFCAKVAGNTAIKKELVKSLVGAFEMRNRGSWLLKSVSNAEVDETWDLSVLFRGNSVASACLDTFMRTVGRQVLDSTLRPILRELYKSNRSCELDPTRAPKGSDLKKNLSFFLETMEWIWSSIQTTIDKMPTTMRSVLAHLRARVAAKWPNDSNSKYTSVTSFLFLRFFCPALMSPQSFDLVEEVPNAQMSRNLALLSKTLMNLANFILYGNKEPNLSPLNEWLTSNFGKMREYIDRLVDDPDGSEIPIVQNPNATLFIYAREMNNLRDFLNQKKDKMITEREIVVELINSLNGASMPSAVAEDGPVPGPSASVEKQHYSDDEDDVVEDLTTGRRISTRKSFRRVSSKSRLAESSQRIQSNGLILGKENSNDLPLLNAYLQLLDRTFPVLDAINVSVLSHQPVPSPVAKRRSLSSSSPSIILTAANGTPVTPKAPQPQSLRPESLGRHNNLESSSPRKRSATTKMQ